MRKKWGHENDESLRILLAAAFPMVNSQENLTLVPNLHQRQATRRSIAERRSNPNPLRKSAVPLEELQKSMVRFEAGEKIRIPGVARVWLS